MRRRWRTAVQRHDDSETTMWGRIPMRCCDHGRAELAACLKSLLSGRSDDATALAGDLETLVGPQACYRLLRRARMGIIAALTSLPVDGRTHVLIPTFACRALPQAILAAGMEPRLADIGQDLNVSLSDLAQRIDDSTSAVIVAHTFAKPADVPGIVRLCQPRDILVIDDAAAAAGVRHEGRLLGGGGDVGIWSFAQQKSLVAGQGGLVMINSLRLRQWMAEFHPRRPASGAAAREALWWLWRYRYRDVLPLLRRVMERFSRGERLDDLSAQSMPAPYVAMLAVQVRRLEQILARRANNCRELYNRLENMRGVSVPQYYAGCSLSRFLIRTPGLKWSIEGESFLHHPLSSYLARHGIQTARPYFPLHLQEAYRRRASGPLPCAQEMVPELIALPVQGIVAPASMDAIARGIRSFFG
ncbi:MAG: DegT/DnrJ/EryC1/StrS family aminotransferase [Planctomycetaceae bacterium]|nr:DegT/DnrJ/EryC1/StrS family aminotransferase [Planctomycetaceae bacterium]